MPKESSSPSSPLSIVLIDDEPDIRDVISISLKDRGYRVETAADGRTGLALCSAKKPQIAITDIRMPGMDGIDLAGAVRRVDPEVPVLFISGSLDDAKITGRLRTELNANPRSGFIAKPFDIEELVAKVKRMLEFRRTRRNG